MGYIDININYNEGTLCEEISFSEPGKQEYTLGSVVTLSDSRLWRDRYVVVNNINYTETDDGGLITTVSGFSLEYKYTRKSPDCDISFFTMTGEEQSEYQKENPSPESKVFMMSGDQYGVGGWDMHKIVQKIAVEWLGLWVENTLPNFWVSDFTINLGSTFFEALTGIVSEFEPIIVLSGGVLYILERNGAGALGGGLFTLDGTTSRSVDLEHISTPGCIKVEGLDGKYIADRDITYTGIPFNDSEGNVGTYHHSGSIMTPEGASETFSISATYSTRGDAGVVLVRRQQTSSMVDSSGHGSSIEIITTITYSGNGVITAENETCSAEIAGAMQVYSIVATAYKHDGNLNLKDQLTSKKELFIYNSDDGSYTKYDPRDFYIASLASEEEAILIASEIRTTKYTRIGEETYGVDTVIANKMWNIEEALWETMYTFEHDIVEAGAQQHLRRGGSDETDKTMQVYAGSCPIEPDLSILDEPARVFSIPTPDWDSIEDCYIYLAALAAYKFQKVQAVTPIIDPLPLMSINGLGPIIESSIIGFNCIRGYNINIDSIDGSTTSLDIEARYA